MNCKKFVHLLIVTFLAVLLAGCSQAASGNGSADNGKETSSLPDEFKQVMNNRKLYHHNIFFNIPHHNI